MAHRLAKKFLEWDEPIPDFASRFPNILESTLAVPFQTFGKRSLYRGLSAKAAALFYLMIKNHPFQNGNKRLAVTSLFVFLHKNGYWMKLEPEQLYRIAVWVAESEAEFKDGVISALDTFIGKRLKSGA